MHAHCFYWRFFLTEEFSIQEALKHLSITALQAKYENTHFSLDETLWAPFPFSLCVWQLYCVALLWDNRNALHDVSHSAVLPDDWLFGTEMERESGWCSLLPCWNDRAPACCWCWDLLSSELRVITPGSQYFNLLSFTTETLLETSLIYFLCCYPHLNVSVHTEDTHCCN